MWYALYKFNNSFNSGRYLLYLFAQMMLHKPFRLAYSKNINKG